jgi:hypothetical protein
VVGSLKNQRQKKGGENDFKGKKSKNDNFLKNSTKKGIINFEKYVFI